MRATPLAIQSDSPLGDDWRVVHDDMERVAGIAEPVDRAKAAIDLMATYQGWVLELSRIRREAIEEAQASGMTQAEIATRLGVSRGRVGQLVSAGPPPERAFFGTDLVTVSLGGKYEAGKAPEQNPSEVVTREDLDNFEHLRKLLSGMKLDAKYEVIPPTGIVNLNRDNHVVICGPRLSPIVAQVLEGDDNLRFSRTTYGTWSISGQGRPTGRRRTRTVRRVTLATSGGCLVLMAAEHSCTSLAFTPSVPTVSCTSLSTTWQSYTARCGRRASPP